VSIEFDDAPPETESANGRETVAFSDMTRPLIPRQTGRDDAPDADDAPPADAWDDDFGPDLEDEHDGIDADDEDQQDDDEDIPGLFALAWAAAKALVTHPGTLGAIRHGAHLTGGVSVLTRNAWESRTTAVHTRMIRAAVARGDHEGALEWEERARKFRAERHERRLALLFAPIHIGRAVLISALVGAGVLLAVGVMLAVGTHRGAEALAPFLALVAIVRFAAAVVNALWLFALVTSGAALLAGLWRTGRARASMPSWLATASDGEVDLEIDETTIAGALKALNIKQINDYLKEGVPLQYLITARAEGRGTRAVLRLPRGVQAEKISKRRADLATGLYRAAKEVWPTTGSEAGILDLWVADKGALAEGAGPYPLLTEGTADFFKGVPLGKVLRGDPVMLPLAGRNTIVGGMPDQGKSSLTRAVAAGASLDPTCEIRIWVPDANFDFEGFRPRCSKYVMGAENEKIRQIRDDLKELHQEVQDRGNLLIKHGEPEVTRKLADKEPGLRPMVCILEEAHVAFNHAEYGKEISYYVVEIVKLDRKRAIHFIVSTQAPTATSIPRDVTRNCTNGAAFAVSDHVANDALLGAGAFRGGHRATELIPGVDKGTFIGKGITGQRSDAVQAYFISITRENDQLTPIIKRALAAIEARNAAVLNAPDVDTEQIDHLGNVAEVMAGQALVGTEEVVHRLKVLRPAVYAEWTTADLRSALEPHQAAPRKATAARTMHVDLALIRDAIDRRDAETGTETDTAEG